MGRDDLDDDLSDLIGQPMRELPAAPPATYQPRAFTEPCVKCRGTGNWRPGYPCFACKGAGKLTFKTAPEQRAKSRAKSHEKANAALAEKAAWREAHKAELEWLHAVANREETKMGMPPFKYWEFPVKLREGLGQHGTLTEGQIGAIRKCMERDAERAAERAKQREAQAAEVSTEGVDRLKADFDKAMAYSAAKGLKLAPRITIDGVTISPAKATSKNPGALYVKTGETYLGKIHGGKFYAARECSPELQNKVLAFMADPAAAAKMYGQTTGTCCVCNATLRSEWKLRGIGPVCAEKFGWGSA